MGVDTSIYQMAGRGVKSIADYDEDYARASANKLALATAQQNNQLGQLKIDEYGRGIEETNKLNRLYSSALGPDGQIDRAKVLTGAATNGLGSKIPGLQKDWTAQDKATGEVDANKFKLAKDRYDTTQKTFGALVNRPDLTKEIVIAEAQQMMNAGVITPELFAKLPATLPDNPQQLRQNLQQRLSSQLSPEQILTVFAPKPEKMDNGQQISYRDTNPNSPTYGQDTGGAAMQKLQSPDSVASIAQQERTSLRADARSRESTAATMSRPFEITGEDGKPVLVQQDKQGNIKPVAGYGPKQGAAGAGTEGERNASGYASRMLEAEKLIGKAVSKDPDAQKPGLIEQSMGGVGMIANSSRSPVRQEYRQAQEDWVRAKLRKESGAAIPNDEMEREITVYFPQIGDKAGVIAQKAEARKVASAAMKQAAGRAFKEPAAAAPSIDALLDKYK